MALHQASNGVLADVTEFLQANNAVLAEATEFLQFVSEMGGGALCKSPRQEALAGV